MVSKEEAYRVLHYHLLRKYAREALANNSAESNGEFCDKARAFFSLISKCEEETDAQIAYGSALVFQGSKVSGKAVFVGRQVIHLSITNHARNLDTGRDCFW